MHTLILGFIGFLAFGFGWAQTPAGTVVRSQAVATVAGELYFSNEVDTLVQAVCGISVTPNGTASAPAHRLSILAGAPSYLPYLVVNTGNAPFSYPLSVRHDASSDWSAADYAFHLDVDRNGRIDPNEAVVERLTLPAGGVAALVLQVSAPPTATGTARLTPLATCPDGRQDGDNTAEITIASDVAVHLEKHAVPNAVEPGRDVTFRISATGVGGRDITTPVTVSDRFDGVGLEGLTFVGGSAVSSSGRLEYFDGRGWGTNEPPSVLGVRLVLPGLDQDQRADLMFTMSVHPDAIPGPRGNRADVTTAGHSSSTRHLFEILPKRVHHLGPAGNPTAHPGGDGSLNDLQTAPHAVQGQPTCLGASLRNGGNATDHYALSIVGMLPGVAVSFQNEMGTPLHPPLELRPDETITFRTCIIPQHPSPDGFTFDLVAYSQRQGSSDATRFAISSVRPNDRVALLLSANPSEVLPPDSDLVYTLTVTNADVVALHDVELRIPIPAFTGDAPPALILVDASHDAVVDRQRETVRWRVPLVGGGASVTRSLTLRTSGAAGDGRIHVLSNAFTLRSDEFVDPLESNTVHHLHPGYELLADLAIGPDPTTVGGRTRFRFTLTNPTRYPAAVHASVHLPPGVVHLPGSSRLVTAGGRLELEPSVVGRSLQWDLSSTSGGLLGPAGSAGDRLVLEFDGVVTPQAPSPFHASAEGSGDIVVAGVPLRLASNVATARAHIRVDAFHAPESLITGRVYLDRNDDGAFTPEDDIPLQRVRLLLANGMQTTTDEHGLYAFRELRAGPWAILLDPSSVPFQQEPRGLRRLVQVQGVHLLDFPLAPPRSDVGLNRSTRVSFGPLTLDKRLERSAAGSRVVLTLSSTTPLDDVTVRDPLPDGSVKTFSIGRLDGERIVHYDLPADAYLTDPEVSWKDPHQ